MAKPLPEPIDLSYYSKVVVRRFTIVDFNQQGTWILDKLSDLFPNVNERNVVGWIRTLLGSTSHSFIYTEKALGLAQISHAPLSNLPIVEEVFVLLAPEAKYADGIPIYMKWKMWSDSMDCKEIRVENFSEIPREYIELGLGKKIERVAYSRVKTGL